jgi:nitrite reductase/ring-hydroxylating ferredoxin subunit
MPLEEEREMSWLTDRLPQLMLERSETVEQVARQLGIERSRLTHIIGGSAIPNENLTKRLAKHFGEDPSQWIASATKREDSRPAPTLPLDFIKVAALSEIPEGEMRIVFNGLVVVANSQGRLHAFGNVCPHAAGPIGEGFLDGNIVECPWHAAQWDITTGTALSGLASADIPVFEVRVVGDNVEIRLTPAVLAQTAISSSETDRC